MTTFSFSLPEAGANVSTITEISGENVGSGSSADHTLGLIGDLAWVLILAVVSTLLFKKLKQPVVLGYILAGFLASPKFVYLPSISNLDNIDFWAELGIVVLMFTLGLEFSFRKLVNAGTSAIVTALVIITGMTFAGFGVGCLLHLDTINCIFLGGMVSMSSTTIILKCLTDLGMRQKKFASLVLAVLIIEDLFAVLMLVFLSSMAVGDVKGSELLYSVAKLCFFLIIWFVVGVYLLPTFLVKVRDYLNEETLLILSMALCFFMAVFSSMCGFSMELGAFVMGSILAGTMAAERMEKVVQPIKDLFGAVFFISVGMMVDPAVLAQYWREILLLAGVVITGMIIFGSLGMLLTGQNLRVAIESGFTLTQIGEFSFIIASLGMGLGVLTPSLYPIIVAVSVITIFTTPYFIKMADPAYRFIEPRLPRNLQFLISRYSKQTVDSGDMKKLWKDILSRYLWRVLLYSVILIAVMECGLHLLDPFLVSVVPEWGHLIATLVTLGCMSPFLVALSFSSTKPNERMKLHQTSGFYDVPLVAMRIVRHLVALLFIVTFLSASYGTWFGWIAGLAFFVLVVLYASSNIKARYRLMEKKFIDNLNIRENTRTGRNNSLVDDLHQAFITVGPLCSFVGDRVRDSGLRRDYGVSLSSIRRGNVYMPLPSIDARIFPGDVLGVIGTDDQIKRLNDDISRAEEAMVSVNVDQRQVELQSIVLSDSSPIIGIPLARTDILRDFFSMIVKVEHDDGSFESPSAETVLKGGDKIWVVGDPSSIPEMK